MSRKSYLFKNTAIFALSNIGTKLINFFLIPLYTYVLTTEQYGTIDLVFTITTIAVPVIILNIDEGIMRFALDKELDSNKILSIGFIAIGLSAIGGFILQFITRFYQPVAGYSWFVFLYAFSSGACNIFLCYLRGKEKLLQFSMGNILRTFTIASLNILFLVYFKLGINGYLYAYILANIITTIYAVIVGKVVEIWGKFIFDKSLFCEMIKYSLPLIPNALMWWVMNSMDRIMITSMVSVSLSGIYAVSSKIPSLVSTVSTIFNQAYSFSAIKEDGSEDKNQFNNKVFRNLTCFITIATIVLMIIIKPFMKYYAAKDFYSAWIYTPPLILGTSIMVLGTFFSVFYTVNKDGVGFLKSGFAGALVNIVLNFMLIPSLHAIGAAIATCAAYITVALYRFIDTRKYIKLNVFTLDNNLCYIAMILSSLLVYIGSWKAVLIDALLLLIVLVRNSDVLAFWKSISISIIKRKR